MAYHTVTSPRGGAKKICSTKPWQQQWLSELGLWCCMKLVSTMFESCSYHRIKFVNHYSIPAIYKQVFSVLMIPEFLYLHCMFLSVALFHVDNHSPVIKPLLLCLLLSICRMNLHTFCIWIYIKFCMAWNEFILQKLKTGKLSYMRFVALDTLLWVLSSKRDFPLYHIISSSWFTN